MNRRLEKSFIAIRDVPCIQGFGLSLVLVFGSRCTSIMSVSYNWFRRASVIINHTYSIYTVHISWILVRAEICGYTF